MLPIENTRESYNLKKKTILFRKINKTIILDVDQFLCEVGATSAKIKSLVVSVP